VRLKGWTWRLRGLVVVDGELNDMRCFLCMIRIK